MKNSSSNNWLNNTSLSCIVPNLNYYNLEDDIEVDGLFNTIEKNLIYHPEISFLLKKIVLERNVKELKELVNT